MIQFIKNLLAMREDAQRWRALMDCDRIRVMGWTKDMNHIGIEFWKDHPARHPSPDFPQDACRARLVEFVDEY